MWGTLFIDTLINDINLKLTLYLTTEGTLPTLIVPFVKKGKRVYPTLFLPYTGMLENSVKLYDLY